jgi:hypothetical protein
LVEEAARQDTARTSADHRRTCQFEAVRHKNTGNEAAQPYSPANAQLRELRRSAPAMDSNQQQFSFRPPEYMRPYLCCGISRLTFDFVRYEPFRPVYSVFNFRFCSFMIA